MFKRASQTMYYSWFLAILLYGPTEIKSQEFVVINQIIRWNMCSSHGFFFFSPSAEVPKNWLRPYDYYNGTFQIRFEIEDEATHEPCGLQFGIWQWQPDTSKKTFFSETMSSIKQMNGPGSVVYDTSSPTTWWKSSHSTISGVDFARVQDFWHMGINVWSVNPQNLICNKDWGGNDEVWNMRSKWFPIEIEVIVVAVAAGHKFSGWDKYLKNSASKP